VVAGPNDTVTAGFSSTLRDAQKQLTRSRLLSGAKAAFASKGYAATTIDDVARAAGVTRATFYLHFDNKGELLGELAADVARQTAEINGRLAKVVARGDRATIAAWLNDAFDFWEAIRSTAIAQEEAAAIEPRFRQARSESFDQGVAAVMRGLKSAGRSDPDGRRARGVLMYSQLQNVFHRWMHVGWEADRGEMLQVMTNMWLAALA
jgi:AcrR family transcriptional regulator